MFVGKRRQSENWVCIRELVSAMGTPGRILPGEWKVIKIDVVLQKDALAVV